jgi:hypothetical protein
MTKALALLFLGKLCGWSLGYLMCPEKLKICPVSYGKCPAFFGKCLVYRKICPDSVRKCPDSKCESLVLA